MRPTLAFALTIAATTIAFGAVVVAVMALQHVPPPPRPAAPPVPLIDQARFADLVDSQRSIFRTQVNEAGRTGTRLDRGADLRSLGAFAFRHWHGRVIRIGTTSEGWASLSIEIAPEIILRTPMEPLLGAVGAENHLIASQSLMFDVLRHKAKGDTIEIGGRFLPDTLDGFREESVTEAGSMQQPEFIVEFEELGP